MGPPLSSLGLHTSPILSAPRSEAPTRAPSLPAAKTTGTKPIAARLQNFAASHKANAPPVLAACKAAEKAASDVDAALKPPS